MKTNLFFLIGLFSTITVAAQKSIKGTVVDEKQKPTKSVSVLLMTKDSLLISAAVSDEFGLYHFSQVFPGHYLVSVSMIGYQTNYTSVYINEKDVEIGVFQLSPEVISLSEVTIQSRKPFLEQKANKLVVNIENSATAAGSTALEVLKKVPGIIVRNDKVSLAGRNNLMILIDGRTSQYTDVNQVLKDISAATISKIEVITNPGAKYDAAGGSIINIILKRNAKVGTNGTLTIAGGVGLYDNKKEGFDRNFYRFSPSINLNHRKGKINVFGSYSFSDRNWFEFNEFDRLIGPDRYFQTNLFYYQMKSHNYRAGVDFYANKKNTFGFLLSGFNRDGSSEMINKTEHSLAANGQTINNFQTLNNIQLKRSNYSANINWKHQFDSTGKELNVDLDYSTFKLNNNSNIINNAESINKSFSNQKVNNPVQFSVFKMDYIHPFKTNVTVETGIKSSYATIDNFLKFTQNEILNTERSTEFFYTENINAGYINFSQKFNKWQLTGGIRAEQTIAKGKSKSIEVLNRNYWQLFPSLFITKNINSHFASVIQYSKRIDRPSYQQQNPFILFLDSLTYTKGNPTLKPQITDAYKFTITYDNQPFFSVSYNKTRDVIFDNAPKQQGNQTFTTPENLAQFENIALELNFPVQIGKKISGFGGNQAIYNHYKANYMGGKYNGKQWNWLAYWQIGYKPVKTWNIEVSGYYITKFLSEFFTIKNQGALNLAIQKSILDNKGKFTLNFNDVLFSEKTRGAILYQDINVRFRQWEDTRNVRLSFTWSFGNQKLNAVRNRNTASDNENKRVRIK